jgi:hypothetical protein
VFSASAGSRAPLSDEDLLGQTLTDKIRKGKTWDFTDVSDRVDELNAKYGAGTYTTDNLASALGPLDRFVQKERGKRRKRMYEGIEDRYREEEKQVAKLVAQGYTEDDAWEMLETGKKPKKRSSKKSPGKKAKSPGKKAKSPGKKAKSPGKKARSPGKKARSPGKKARSPGKKYSAEENRTYLAKQTIPKLKEYIKSKGLKGYSSLKKAGLVDFILKHVDVDSGEVILPQKKRSPRKRAGSKKGSKKGKAPIWGGKGYPLMLAAGEAPRKREFIIPPEFLAPAAGRRIHRKSKPKAKGRHSRPVIRKGSRKVHRFSPTIPAGARVGSFGRSKSPVRSPASPRGASPAEQKIDSRYEPLYMMVQKESFAQGLYNTFYEQLQAASQKAIGDLQIVDEGTFTGPLGNRAIYQIYLFPKGTLQPFMKELGSLYKQEGNFERMKRALIDPEMWPLVSSKMKEISPEDAADLQQSWIA